MSYVGLVWGEAGLQATNWLRSDQQVVPAEPWRVSLRGPLSQLAAPEGTPVSFCLGSVWPSSGQDR